MMKTLGPLVVLLSLATTGCGDGGAAVLKRRSDLDHLGAAYLAYHRLHQQSPADTSQLLEFMSESKNQSKAADSAMTALQEGDILLIWNGELGETLQLGDYVLGFEAGVPARGGYVVMADGEVKVFKRVEFESASMLPPAE